MPKATTHGSSNAWEDLLPVSEGPEPVRAVLLDELVVEGRTEEPELEEVTVVQDDDEVLAGNPRATEVRSWALGNGIEVSSRGAIPTAVMDAYVDAHREA